MDLKERIDKFIVNLAMLARSGERTFSTMEHLTRKETEELSGLISKDVAKRCAEILRINGPIKAMELIKTEFGL